MHKRQRRALVFALLGLQALEASVFCELAGCEAGLPAMFCTAGSLLVYHRNSMDNYPCDPPESISLLSLSDVFTEAEHLRPIGKLARQKGLGQNMRKTSWII